MKQVVSTFDPVTQGITGTSVTSYFMAGLYEETDGVARRYYAISGMTVAMSDSEGMKYLLTDHLGSVTAVTDDDGTLLQQQRYKPFGQVRTNVPQPIPDSPITQTDFGYTGQRDLAGMGLMDYKARLYDSNIGRFIQPDTIIPNPADPQGWNRYSYVLNNPLLLVDPTGHFGKHHDEKSDYWNKRNQEKVQTINKKGEEERAVVQLLSLFPAAGEGTLDAETLSNSAGVLSKLPGKLSRALALALAPSGTKLEFFVTAAIFGGGQWGVSLITTRTGDVQLYKEHGFVIAPGPNLGGSITRGPVFGLETAQSYQGPAHTLAMSYEIGTIDGWLAEDRGAGGYDVGVSLSAAVPGPTYAHTTAVPIDGWGMQLSPAGLLVCRLMLMCGG